MEAHSIETRRGVIRVIEEGDLTQEEIADRFEVSSRWVRGFYRRWCETGRMEPLPHSGGFPPKITSEVDQQLREYIKQHSDATLAETRAGCGLTVSLAAICHALKRLGLGRKKKSCTHLSKTDRTFSKNGGSGSIVPARSTPNV